MIRLLLVALLVVVLFGWAMPLSPAGRQRFKRWTLRAALAMLLIVLLRSGLVTLSLIGAGVLAVLRFALPTLIRLLPTLAARRATAFSGQVPPSAKPPRDMSRAQALEVLNLNEGATRGEILDSHRELIKKLHPDRGGSSYLAAQVNRARDVLLQ